MTSAVLSIPSTGKSLGKPPVFRTMAMYLSWELGGHKHSEIGKTLGFDYE
jgi:hypothetical protein